MASNETPLRGIAMNAKIQSAKEFAIKHQTKILATVAVVSTTVAVASQIGLRQVDQFLRDHDLYDEYYTPDKDN